MRDKQFRCWLDMPPSCSLVVTPPSPSSSITASRDLRLIMAPDVTQIFRLNPHESHETAAAAVGTAGSLRPFIGDNITSFTKIRASRMGGWDWILLTL